MLQHGKERKWFGDSPSRCATNATLMSFGVARNLYNAIKVCPEFSARLRKTARSGLSRYGVSEGAYIYQDGFSITRESDSASRGTPKFRSPFLERAVNIHTGLGDA